MNLGDTTKPLGDGIFGRRFYLVGYLPIYAAALFLLLIVWAGARGWHTPVQGSIDFARAWHTAAGLSIGQVVILLLGVTFAAVLLQPLQLLLLRVLEGEWWPAKIRNAACRFQQTRKQRLSKRAEFQPLGKATEHQVLTGDKPPEFSPQLVQEVGVAGRRLRQRFPLPDHLVRPTGLGNILAAMEDTAGRQYGMDAVILWPRLYTVLSDQVRELVDTRRDSLDAAARMAVVMLLTTVLSLLLLLDTGWWLLLPLLPLGLSVLAYCGAIQGALAYAEAVQVAFDMNRTELVEALRLPRPRSSSAEDRLNKQWSDFWRQGIPLPPDISYEVNESEHRIVLREKK
jgi:hypothetical protein